ncbi:MAG: c-type cytochrome [Planctomycetota bacterium]
MTFEWGNVVPAFSKTCGLVLVALGLLTIPYSACKAGAPAPSEQVGPGASAAERGYHWLLTKEYGTGDFGNETFDSLWTVWPEDLKKKAEGMSSLERRKLAFSRYGLIERPGTEGKPLGFVVDEKGRWTMNCFACHGGKVAGKVMPGVGNSHFAFQTFAQDVLKYRIEKGKAQPRELFSQMLTPLGKSNGTTNAQIFSVGLVAMRDPELHFVRPKQIPRLVHHDLDAPPLWNVKKKKRIYIDGYVEKSHRVIMQFVLIPSNDSETIKSWESDFADILAWIESLEAPKYPWPVDKKLAELGRPLFEKTCAGCHGKQGEKYPERTIPIDELGTDSLRLTGMSAEHRRFFKSGWMGVGENGVEEHPEGYVAPPLDGIWASAPYFHNGAVPTLWHVMHPDQRPAVWLRTEDGYDQEKVGLEVAGFNELPQEVKDPAEQRRYFNSRIAGKSVAGHDYPNDLTEDEKRAVLEYLKTL